MIIVTLFVAFVVGLFYVLSAFMLGLAGILLSRPSHHHYGRAVLRAGLVGVGISFLCVALLSLYGFEIHDPSTFFFLEPRFWLEGILTVPIGFAMGSPVGLLVYHLKNGRPAKTIPIAAEKEHADGA